MSGLTEKESQVLLKLREKLSDLNLDDEKSSDAYLIRWLRARDLNIKKAEESLRDSLKWREENKIDSILEWEAPSKYAIMFPTAQCGYDKFGHPVCIIPTKFTDPSYVSQCGKEEYFRYSLQNLEKLMIAMRKYSTKERSISQCVLIYDLDQANIRPYLNKRHYDLVQESSKLFNENYPEIVYKAYFINCPKLFTVLMAMCKPVIPKRSLEKFKIYGTNKESWKAELLSHIPEDQLPACYGGTDEEFEKITFQNCTIPGTSTHINTEDEDIADLIEANVPAGRKLTIDYIIDEPKSTLKWNFKSLNHDIGFSVHMDGEEIINQGRVESHKKRQEGIIICEKQGSYSVVFENSYSRMRSKTIYYRVEIEGPTQ